jgi:hypothetical protein
MIRTSKRKAAAGGMDAKKSILDLNLKFLVSDTFSGKGVGRGYGRANWGAWLRVIESSSFCSPSLNRSTHCAIRASLSEIENYIALSRRLSRGTLELSQYSPWQSNPQPFIIHLSRAICAFIYLSVLPSWILEIVLGQKSLKVRCW